MFSRKNPRAFRLWPSSWSFLNWTRRSSSHRLTRRPCRDFLGSKIRTGQNCRKMIHRRNQISTSQHQMLKTPSRHRFRPVWRMQSSNEPSVESRSLEKLPRFSVRSRFENPIGVRSIDIQMHCMGLRNLERSKFLKPDLEFTLTLSLSSQPQHPVQTRPPRFAHAQADRL
jgi:hypothetical protein